MTEKYTPESLCCLCDNPVIFADYAVAIANGAYVLVHRHCLDDALEDTDEENQRLLQEIEDHECPDWEAKDTWHTATGKRPAEIDGYPLGDMDAVEAEEYQTNEEPPTLGILSAKDVPWHRVTDYRRVYLDGLPCVMDDKSIEKWAKWVATDKNRGPHQFQFRPEWNSDLWAADEGYAMKHVLTCYATPGDPALSLRRVWREQPC